MNFFILFAVLMKVSKGQRGCYFSILDRSRPYTCVDERGGVITDFSPREVEHTTVCTYRRCDTLRHIECADGRWVDRYAISLTQDNCAEAQIVAKQLKRRKRGWFWSSRSPPPPPPPPPTNCGYPGNVTGASVHLTSTQEGGIATYTCEYGYMYIEGDLTRTCLNTAQWSGTEPVCAYMNSCSSNPCKNGGTCLDIPWGYTCSCPEIWKGTNCELVANVCARNPCVNHVRCEDGDTSYTCICKPGWSGQNCNVPVSCGDPGLIVSSNVTAPGITLGDVATYACHTGYNATDGNKERICQSDGTWSGEPLVCKFASSCSCSPCRNNATCTNLIETFECTCVHGWVGRTCDEDVQPPLVANCSNDIRVNATERSQTVSWIEPIFTDPMDTELRVVSNYKSLNYTFPWGDFTVQYSATKLKNGLRTECAFNIFVRPTPCDQLPRPKQGAILCNNWSPEYGQFCLLACERTYSPSPPGRLGIWMICGDDGRWSSQPTDCSLHLKNESNVLTYHPNYDEFVYKSCSDYQRLTEIYLNHMLKHPDISQYCQIYPGCEGSSSVRIDCDP